MLEKECNRQFLKSALCRQLFYCCDKPHYQAGVLVSSRDKIKLLDILLTEIISDNFSSKLTRKMNSQYDYRLIFDNGSYFKIVVGTDGARGHRYHDILIDNELDEENQFSYGRAKIIPYRPSFEDFETDGVSPNLRIVQLIIK